MAVCTAQSVPIFPAIGAGRFEGIRSMPLLDMSCERLLRCIYIGAFGALMVGVLVFISSGDCLWLQHCVSVKYTIMACETGQGGEISLWLAITT